MESELFGHTRGAFTGAAAPKKGLIELANGGTAFFDEIGDLPLDMQVKLLRLLQEREFRAVGSLERRKVEIRIIAATHRNLEQRVAKEVFRQDLYYRLNVAKIRLPPLRERKEDIPLLVDHFLAGMGCCHRFTAKAMDLMMATMAGKHARASKNAVERGYHAEFRHARSTWIIYQLRSRPSTARRHRATRPRGGSPEPMARRPCARCGRGRRSFPCRRPNAAPSWTRSGFTKGDRGKAASLLQISRTTLYRKLKEYQITD